jgi:two-component system nitrate/nitrite response regulator NarL
MGLEQVLDGTCFIVSDATLYGPFQPSPFDKAAPDLFILDEKSCSTEIPGLAADLKAYCSGARVILLADRFEFNTIVSAWHAGVDGFCLTTSSRDVLIHSISLVMLGEVVVPSEQLLPLLEDSVHDVEHPHWPTGENLTGAVSNKPLSEREVEVLSMLKKGAPNKIIARKLNVAEATVKVHVKAILRKLGVGNRAQAAIWAAYHLPLEPAFHE